MWQRTTDCAGGLVKFFRLIVGDDSLANYYRTNFALMQSHKYNLEEIEAMLPWERDIYLVMLLQYIEEEKQRIEQMNQQNQRKVK